MVIESKPLKRLKLLFADDEASLQELMSIELPRMGHEVTVCPDGMTAFAALDMNAYDCLIVDLDMPGRTGIQVVTRAKELDPDVDAVILTGKSTLESAIAAVNLGAIHYLTKPFKWTDVENILRRVAERRTLVNKVRALNRRLERHEGKTQLVGRSPKMQQVRTLVERVAPTDSTVLILGETGTGKELVARSIHEQSLRAEKPFVAVNCGALPENLIESELFGHRKGSFTGADEHRVGLFEVADGGTLFLDEIGELPKSMQAKLLRVLESGEIRRVGDNASFVVDVRVLCATHRNLEQMVADGEFREDLLFRINTFEVAIPPLRERAGDLPELAGVLLRRVRPSARPDEALFAPDTLRTLQTHSWPGNVRELANVIEHAAILGAEGPIGVEHLPGRFSRAIAGKITPQLRSAVVPQTLRDIEMAAIHESLARNSGNKPKTAEELGISLKTLYNKLNSAGNLEQAG